MFRIICLFMLVTSIYIADLKKFDDTDSSKIIEGTLAGGKQGNKGQYPYIIRWKKRGTLWCGGTIIQPNVVLTAAHCIKDYDIANPKDMTVVAGTFNLRGKPDPSKQERTVETIARFPGYNNKTQKGDFALMFLEQPFIITEYVKPIKLSDENVDEKFLVGKNVMIMGWGLTENRVESEDLLIARGKVEDFVICNQTLVNKFGNYIVQYHSQDQRHVCFKGDNNMLSGAGLGDSGGPLVLLNDSENPADHVQIGVSSLVDYLSDINVATHVKGSKVLSFYTDVGLIRYWIDSTLDWWKKIKNLN